MNQANTFHTHMIMSDEITSIPEEILDDLALRHALGTLEGAERVQFEACLGCQHSRAAALAAEYREVVAAVTAALLPHQLPPPEVKARVLESIHSRRQQLLAPSVPPLAAAMIVAGGDLPWMATPHRGVRIRELSVAAPDYFILMIACDAGAAFPPHGHDGAEDVYLLSGEACLGEQVLRAGDFMHAEAGSHHHAMISQSGCQALLITSRKNYSPRAARAYDLAHRAVKRVGKALGVAGN